MYGYQQQYVPQFVRARALAQTPPVAPTTAVVPVPVPTSPVAKTVTTLVTLGVTTAAAAVGIREGLKGKGAYKVAGWVGGVGAGLLGLATLINLISPPSAQFIMQPFRLPSA
jgi:hypothetical protein